MRDMHLQLRGLLAILALTFLGTLPAAADLSDLGITVGQLLEIVEDNRDPAMPVEIKQENRRVEIALTRAGTPGIRILTANNHDEQSEAPATSLWIGFGVAAQTEAEKFPATFVVDALWKHFTGGEDLESWMARIEDKMLRRGAYAETIDGVRIGVYANVPTWFFIDTFTECRIDKDLTEARYGEMQAKGLCPSRLGP
jgi:hypothetical protein